MLTQDQVRERLEDLVLHAIEAGMTKEEIKDEIDYILKSYEDES